MNIREIYLYHPEAFESSYALFDLLPSLSHDEAFPAALYAICFENDLFPDLKSTRKYDDRGRPLKGGQLAYKALGVPSSIYREFLEALDFREEEQLQKARKKFKPKKVAEEKRYQDYLLEPFMDGYALKKYLGNGEGEVSLPESVDDLPLLAILPHAFEFKRCQRIVLPSSVKYILKEGFANCYCRNVYCQEGLLYIGKLAFHRSAVESLHLPGSLRVIDDSAFFQCEHLKDVVLPESLLFLGPNAFAFSAVEKIRVPKEIRSLVGTFTRCPNLAEVVLPDGLTLIGDNCFQENKSLKRINAPSNLEEIGDFAFQGCMYLKYFSFPLGLRVIGESAFRYFESPTLDLPMSLREIRAGAFEHAYVKSVELPEGLEILGPRAFAECTWLHFVRLPSSLKALDHSSLAAESYYRIEYKGTKAEWKKVEKTNLLKGPKFFYAIYCLDGETSFEG